MSMYFQKVISRKTFFKVGTYFVRILKVNDENSRIRIRIQIWIHWSDGMAPRIPIRIHTKNVMDPQHCLLPNSSVSSSSGDSSTIWRGSLPSSSSSSLSSSLISTFTLQERSSPSSSSSVWGSSFTETQLEWPRNTSGSSLIVIQLRLKKNVHSDTEGA
jgi:hypothetical protein